AVLAPAANGGLSISLGFDLAATWGYRPRYHVGGAVEGCPIRGIITADYPSWCSAPPGVAMAGGAWARLCARRWAWRAPSSRTLTRASRQLSKRNPRPAPSF